MRFFEQEPTSVELLGRTLRCLLRGHDESCRRETLLNTAAATFFNFDWANQSGLCYGCARCGYIHWFLPQ